MKGTILGYYEEKSSGAISGDDGTRYKFTDADFMGQGLPVIGSTVDFEVENGEAKEIYPLAGHKTAVSGHAGAASGGSKSKVVAGLLGIFLNGLGIHKFYLGRSGAGLIMLLTFLFGWIFLGLPVLVVCVIGFIEGVLYLVKSDEEFDRIYVQEGKSWF